MILVWSQRQLARSSETRFLVQATVTPTSERAVNEAQTDFIEALYPYYRNQEQQKKDRQVDVLQKWVSGGPVVITPQVEARGRVRSREMLVRGEEAKRQKQEKLDTGQLVKLSSKAWREQVGAKRSVVRRVRRRK